MKTPKGSDAAPCKQNALTVTIPGLLTQALKPTFGGMLALGIPNETRSPGKAPGRATVKSWLGIAVDRLNDNCAVVDRVEVEAVVAPKGVNDPQELFNAPAAFPENPILN